MKKNRSLWRVYLTHYIIWVFSAWVAPMASIKKDPSLVMFWILFALSFVMLGLFITSHVLYNKKNHLLFTIFSISAFGLYDIYLILGLIFTLTLGNVESPYFYIVLIIAIVAEIITTIFYIKSLKKSIAILKGKE